VAPPATFWIIWRNSWEGWASMAVSGAVSGDLNLG
jgi:hypothetical protein